MVCRVLCVEQCAVCCVLCAVCCVLCAVCRAVFGARTLVSGSPTLHEERGTNVERTCNLEQQWLVLARPASSVERRVSNFERRTSVGVWVRFRLNLRLREGWGCEWR